MLTKTAIIVAVALLGTAPARAQAPGVPVEHNAPRLQDPAQVAQVRALRRAGRLLERPQVVALLKNPRPAALALPPAGTQPLTGREVAERARKATLRIGWYELCPDCGQWHFDLAGGYAISDDGAAVTCYHCIEPDPKMRQGYLVALDPTNTVLPVTAVLAADKELDAAIVRVAGGTFTPLPLNDNAAPGDAAYTLSDPLDVVGYFSAGVVNRFYWLSDKPDDATTLSGARKLRLNVSTDWAPGSSGAAVLDGCGNAIGHVATISPLCYDLSAGTMSARRRAPRPSKPPPDDNAGTPLILLHEAVPARGVLLLARRMEKVGGR